MPSLTSPEFMLGVLAYQAVIILVLAGVVIWLGLSLYNFKQSMGRALNELLNQDEELARRQTQLSSLLSALEGIFMGGSGSSSPFGSSPQQSGSKDKGQKSSLSSILDRSHLNVVKDGENKDNNESGKEDTTEGDKDDSRN